MDFVVLQEIPFLNLIFYFITFEYQYRRYNLHILCLQVFLYKRKGKK